MSTATAPPSTAPATGDLMTDAATIADLLRRLPPLRERRAIRERVGVTQQRLADHLGVSAALVGCWERGERGFSVASLTAYVEVLEALRGVLLDAMAGRGDA